MTRNRPIYSIRTSLGRELWWTTSRKKALEIAEQLTEHGDYVYSNGCVGHSGPTSFDRDRDGNDIVPLRAHDLPVAVYKSSVVKV